MNNLKIDDISPIDLGGTGDMYLTVIDGNDYLFKPALNKSHTKVERFRADVQVVGYNIQKLVDLNSAICCFTGNVVFPQNTKSIYGAFQEKIETKHLDLKNWQKRFYSNKKLESNIINGIMREAVTDYLLCNFDSHGGNFILGTDDILRGVDKEQSLRYVNDIGTTIYLNCSPNCEYGEIEPIFCTLMRKYSTGVCNIDLSLVNKYFDNVDKVSDDDYIKIYSDYLASLKKAFNQSDYEQKEIVKNILARKNNVRSEFNKVFEQASSSRQKYKHM